ncbi:MAG TPA: EscU/YscU/HrcU family type III secretion system export apparatus switch protein [Pirellulales bacterium]|jgi:flagellar biosynthetic protein FlhB|nr:EscU/YscU/HrcU family type III secretion system export apparatus switch protein [Pirellulales bacterium]
MEQGGEKTQDATPHRRQQAREQGQVARSHDLGSALMLIGGVSVLYWFFGPLAEFLSRYMAEQLGGRPWLSADTGFVLGQWQRVLPELAGVMLPIFGLGALLGAIAGVMQVGLLFLPERLMPDIMRLDPLQGLQRIFSLAGAVRLGFGLIKVVIIGSVAWVVIQNERDRILGLALLDVPQIARYALELLFWTSLKIGVVLLILALFDYGFQWWKQEQDLKMTTQEVREEMKNLQGDPAMVARRRAVQRQLILHRLSNTVPKADVVITNPTELAVAIQYEPKTMAAPIVVAKGAGLLAQRIRRLALEHGIPVVEKKPLAQSLYKDVDLNRPIPGQMYAAVAEVLAYVYQLKGKKMPA